MRRRKVGAIEAGAILEELAKAVVTALCAVLFSLLIGFLLSGYVHVDEYGSVHCLPNPPLFFAAFAGILAFALMSGRFLRRVRPGVLYAAAAVCLFAAGMFFLGVIEQSWTWDANHVYESMLRLRERDYTIFEPDQYLAVYPHQLGFILLERAIAAFAGENLAVFCVVWLLLTLCNHLLIWRITSMLTAGDRLAENLSILLGAAFLPSFLLFLFIYGDTPGLTLTLLAVYFALRFMQGGESALRLAADGAMAFVAICVGGCLRLNYIIFAMALAILLLLRAIRHRRVGCLILAVACVAGPFLCKQALIAHYERESGYSIEGAPLVLWVDMGLQEGNRMPGGYNGFLRTTLKKCDYDYEKAREAGEQALRERLAEMARNPRYTARFLLEKLRVTWGEGTLGSIWISYGTVGYPQYVKNRLAQAVFDQGRVRWAMDVYCSALLLAIDLFALINLLLGWTKRFRAKNDLARLLPYVVFLGFFFFELVWETQSRYVFPAVFMLLPAAAQGAARSSRLLEKKARAFRAKRARKSTGEK